MKIIISASGKAPRLLPLTKDTPQSMLRVGEKTILEKQIKVLKKAGLNDIVVTTGYLSTKLENFCNKLELKTLFDPFYEISGIATNLWIAKDEIKDGCIFLYSDVLFDSEIIEGLLKSEKDISLAVKKDGKRGEAEKVIESGGIIKKVTKENLDGVNGEFVGIAKFSSAGAKKIIKELKDTLDNNYKLSLIGAIDNLIKKGEVIEAYDIKSAKVTDIDFPEDLEKANKLNLL
ncbi:MAG: phosphocholine cytidylyltransferase family protein [bacterium]